jgi:NADH-quinone oxidoreductase subunit L
LEDKWLFDEAYNNTVVNGTYKTAQVLNTSVEHKTIDASVNGVGKFIYASSNKLRKLQSGMVGFYLFIMVVGVILLFSLLFFIN